MVLHCFCSGTATHLILHKTLNHRHFDQLFSWMAPRYGTLVLVFSKQDRSFSPMRIHKWWTHISHLNMHWKPKTCMWIKSRLIKYFIQFKPNKWQIFYAKKEDWRMPDTLKTLFNIVEAPFKKVLNFDICVVWWCSDGPINSQEYKSLKFMQSLSRNIWLNIIIW